MSRGHFFADELLQSTHDFVRTQTVGDHFNSVGGGYQRTAVAYGITVIAQVLLFKYFVQGDRFAPRGEVDQTSLRPFFGRGDQKKLALRAGKYDGTLVTTLTDDIEAAGRETDPARQAEVFRRAETILVEQEMPIVPVYYYKTSSMIRPQVKGFHPNPINRIMFHDLRIRRPEGDR